MSEHTQQPSATSSPKKRRPWIIRHAWWWVPLVLIVVLVVLLPTLLSTGVGRSIIVGQINNRIAGRADITDISL